MRQLKYKILLFILPVIVIPLGAASFISEHSSSALLTETASNNLQTIAQGVLETLTVRFDRARQDRRIIATSPLITTYMAQLEFGLNVEAANSLNKIQKFFEEFYSTSGAYSYIRLIDSQGKVIAQAGKSKEPIEDNDFFDRFAKIKYGRESEKMSPVRNLPGIKDPVVSFGIMVHGDFKGEDGRYDQWAVLTLDLDWTQVTAFLNGLKAGRAVLVGNQARVLSHPDREKVTKANLMALPMVKEVLQAKPGDVMTGFMIEDGVEYYTVAQPIAPDKYRRWGLFLQLPRKELLAGAVQMRNLIIQVAAICVLAAVIGILISAQLITKPIHRLDEATKRVASGDLTYKAPIDTKDEIGRLAEAFNKMTEDLVVHIAELERTTAERERLESELNIASEIQSSFLPQTEPELAGIQVAGLSLPARETGGDFFDYVYDEGHPLTLTIFDVSGKGLPAALFMLLTRSALRTLGSQTMDPSEVLTRANTLIEQDSAESGMFVTTFYSQLDPKTRKFTYANGGHNPPMLFRSDGRVEELKATGIALGLMDGMIYDQNQVTLEPGDLLLLYTDGVTEAINPDEEEFGVARLRTTVESNRTMRAAEVVNRIKDTVFDFCGTEPQFDDFTLTVVKIEDQAIPVS